MVTIELEKNALPDLCNEIENMLQRLSEYDINPRSNLKFSIVDIAERFAIWATNIGAKQKSSTTTSLQFRVREAPKLGRLFLARLQDLLQDLEDLATALEEQPLYVVENASLVTISTTSDDHEWLEDSNPVSDITELLKAASEDVSGLFSLSIAARKASGRDRYARALHKVAPSCVLPKEKEIQHVTELYPTLRFPELKDLKMQLVDANNVRRRYLKYCEEHQKASAQDSVVVAPQYPLTSDIADTTTIGTETRASNVQDEAFEGVSRQLPESLELEQQSVLTYETQSFANLVYEVPRLEDTNGGRAIFICPFCRTEQSIMTQSAWRSHVFADLKAYVCTFQDCSLMFENSREWFAHELAVHRRMQRCPYCNEYESSQDLHQHMNESHAADVEQSQISTLLGSSVQEVDRISVRSCQFCDWHTKITSFSSTYEKGQEVYVSSQRFRRHVGAHLEEVALSTAVERTLAVDPLSDSSEVEDDASERNATALAAAKTFFSSRWNPTSEAIDLLEDSLRPYKSSTDHDPPQLEAMSMLAKAYQMTDRLPEAEETQRIVVENYMRMVGNDHSDTIHSKHELANIYTERGDYQNAVDMLRYVAEAHARTLDEDDPDRLKSKFELASAYRENGQTQTATQLLEDVVEAHAQALTRNDPERLGSRRALVKAYRQNGQDEKAIQLLEEEIEYHTTFLGENCPSRLVQQHELAKAYLEDGETEQAIELLEHMEANLADTWSSVARKTGRHVE